MRRRPRRQNRPKRPNPPRNDGRLNLTSSYAKRHLRVPFLLWTRGSRMDIFLQQIINGLVLGSVYALVALGYTMVYGIIQLINFAHGDVVMVGALVAFDRHCSRCSARACRCRWRSSARRSRRCRLHGWWADDRAGRLPAAAPRAAARAADHRDRRVDHAAVRRADHLEPQSMLASRRSRRPASVHGGAARASPTCRSFDHSARVRH